MITGDTIAAIATAPGRGGVAVVRVSGPEAWSVAERVAGRRPICGRVLLSRFSSCSRNSRGVGEVAVDKGLVLAFKAPNSYTGEDVVEFQCHGGAVTPRRVLEACLAAGARLAGRGEFTQRAFLNGKLDYDQAASVIDLVDAKTVRAADAALEGLAGRRQRELKSLYGRALDLSARIEHALDVDEGELPDGFAEKLRVESEELRVEIARTIRKVREGKILRTGALVVLAGPPNAGKSSLMNALLEENRAIVSDVPGTTRDSIEEWLDLDGWPVRLVDTAGLRAAKDEVEVEGVRRAEDLIAKADLVLWLGAGPQPIEQANNPNNRTILLHAKCDLGKGDGLNVSAKTGEGLEELRREIVARLERKVATADEGEVPEGEVAALHEALAVLVPSSDLVLLANAVRSAAERLGAAVGAVYSADLLDNLFSRFCVGK